MIENAFVRRMMMGPDARSSMGTFSRGKPVYKGTSAAPKRGRRAQSDINRQAIERRLKNGR